MGQHPEPFAWGNRGEDRFRMSGHIPNRLTDEHCQFLDDNVGISRRTLRHVHAMFNERFEMALSWELFTALRKDAIREGRAKTTYMKNYFKNENSSERELRTQRPYLRSRITGGCQFIPAGHKAACGAPTTGRYCETHVHLAFDGDRQASKRGISYIDSTLGKYG